MEKCEIKVRDSDMRHHKFSKLAGRHGTFRILTGRYQHFGGSTYEAAWASSVPHPYPIIVNYFLHWPTELLEYIMHYLKHKRTIEILKIRKS